MANADSREMAILPSEMMSALARLTPSMGQVAG